ncbi:MAG: hypothetical protein KDE20_26440, partial [Caldilineaceae bacterium]|nr:hypothetical protein [Caldilineaceae bacterium]
RLCRTAFSAGTSAMRTSGATKKDTRHSCSDRPGHDDARPCIFCTLRAMVYLSTRQFTHKIIPVKSSLLGTPMALDMSHVPALVPTALRR